MIAAVIGSPLLYAAFEFISDKLRARVRYSGWQAVFLDQGQVYFGKVSSMSRNDLALTDIYYLQKDGKNAGLPKGDIPTSFSLVKLGSEIHGPQDSMTISRSHITFTESLKDDAKVIEAITDHKREKRLENVKLAGLD